MKRTLYSTIFFLFLGFASFAQPQFDFELRSDNQADGVPGDILIIIGDFTNLSNEPIDVLITREQDNIPGDWNSALCLDICLPPSVNQTVWTLNPGEDESFSMYFFTSLNTEGSGNTLISFVNMADTSNNFVQDYFGMTEFISTSVEEPEQQIDIEVFPNPAMDFIQVRFPNQARLSTNGGQINLISLTGRLVGSFPFRENENIPISDLPKGHYLLQYSDDQGNKFTNRFVKM